MKLTFWKELVKRLKSESPKFFIKLQNAAITAIGAGTAIYLALKALPAEQFTMPAIGDTIYGYLMVASVVLGVVAKSTVKNPEELKK